MMITTSRKADNAKYARCPECGAINMWHRETCYCCRRPLAANLSEQAVRDTQDSLVFNSNVVPNRRRATRKRLTITDVGVGGQATFKHQGTALDITPLGICMRTTCPFRIGARINLMVPLGGRIHKLAGYIRHREEGEKDGAATYTYGIQLDTPHRDTFEAIERL